MAALLCALFITAMPAVALADQPDTDIVCGTAESERQDAAADRPDISALHAIVVGKDGTVYYERAADEQVKIASITKVMTAIVALDNAPLDTTITVPHNEDGTGTVAVRTWMDTDISAGVVRTNKTVNLLTLMDFRLIVLR